MSDLRTAAQQALEALEWISDCYVGDDDAGECASCHERSYKPHAPDCKKNNAITALRSALAQQDEPVEPVAHRVVAGALFDLMGWLTSRRERLVLSSTDDAAPAADAIKDFAEMRGLSLDDAKVQDWDAALAQQAEPVGQLAELQAMLRAEVDRLIAAGIQPQRKLVPLTEAEIEHIGITHQSLRQVARAVERAVWEKNNG